MNSKPDEVRTGVQGPLGCAFCIKAVQVFAIRAVPSSVVGVVVAIVVVLGVVVVVRSSSKAEYIPCITRLHCKSQESKPWREPHEPNKNQKETPKRMLNQQSVDSALQHPKHDSR